MVNRHIAAVLALVALAVLVVGCGKKETAKVGKGPTVGVTLLRKSDPFYWNLESAMREEAKKEGVTLRVQSAEMDLHTQTGQVEDFIAQKVDAIVVCPVDSKSIAGAIRKANDAKIPVFTADIAAQGGDVVSHIASDNVAGGRLAGEYMVKLLGGKGKIVIVNHPIVTSVQDRVRGFKEAIVKSNIRIVDDQACEGLRDKAMAVMENLLQKHRDLNGVFAINDSTALGCLAAIRQAKRTDVAIVGYDGDPEARQEILAGSPLKADAVQFPREIGKVTVQTIAKYLKGEQVPKIVPIKVGIIDQESLKKEAKDNPGSK
jgi:ribose transport system substrate-binding protein